MRLHIRPETLCCLIVLAREFQAKEAVVIPDSLTAPSEDWALQILADHAGDYNLNQFTQSVAEMSPRQRAELVALLWLGRGDFAIEEWEEAVDQALGDFSVRAAAYLLAHPMVSDHLQEGMIAHGLDCNE